MSREIAVTSRFRKDLKRIASRDYDLGLLDEVVGMLVEDDELPEKYADHALSGEWKDHRECHIRPDWLLIYRIGDDLPVLVLSRTGTHSDLF